MIKHHICNANLMRNGADFSVFINTAADFDGSDAGAKPDEAVSWGKIKLTAKPVKVRSVCVRVCMCVSMCVYLCVCMCVLCITAEPAVVASL